MGDNPSSTALPSLAPSGSKIAPVDISTTEVLPFTDAQVEEYREQDRWLPVSLAFTSSRGGSRRLKGRWRTLAGDGRILMVIDCECGEDHEELAASDGQGLEGSQGVRTGMRLRVYQLYCMCRLLSPFVLFPLAMTSHPGRVCQPLLQPKLVENLSSRSIRPGFISLSWTAFNRPFKLRSQHRPIADHSARHQRGPINA
jgi:hypothetical protein